jgi:hypothetical protein
VIKRLANKLPLRTGKLEVNLDSIFDPDYNEAETVAKRDEERKGYLRKIGFEV